MLAALGPIGFCLADRRLHAEHLDDDADRPRRSSSPTTCTSRPTAGCTPTSCTSAPRPGAGRAAHLRGTRAPDRARRRRLPAQGLGPGAVRRRRGGDDRRLRRGPAPRHEEPGWRELAGLRGRAHVPADSWQIFRREPEIRRFLFANAAWEGTFAAARTFVVLYVIKGLGEPLSISSAVLGAVGVGYVLAAIVASRLGDRFGLARVIVIASFVYGGGLLVAGLADSGTAGTSGFILPVAFAGRTVMTLCVGAAVQADARAASRGGLRPGDHHEGDRACSSGRCSPG